MTVRIQKPTFTLRDKINQLDLPIGEHGLELLKARTPEETFRLARAGRRRMNANGDMRICQTASTSKTFNGAVNTAGPDLWTHYVNGFGTWTASQDNDVPYHKEFAKSLKLQCVVADTAYPASNDYFYSMYRFEAVDGWRVQYGTPYAQPVSVSFWIKSNQTGLIGVNLENESNEDPTTGSDRVCPRKVLIGKPDTWEFKTLTFPGDYKAGMDYYTAKGLVLEFFWSGGSSYGNDTGEMQNWDSMTDSADKRGRSPAYGGINFGDSTSNYISLTGVQAEVGDAPTPFEHRDYAEELALCMRRVQVLGAQYGMAPGAYEIDNSNTNAGGYIPPSNGYNVIGRGWSRSSGLFQTMTFLPVPMLEMPTASVYDFDDVNSPNTSFYAQYNGTSTTTVTLSGLNSNGSNLHSIWLDWNPASNAGSVTPCHVGSISSPARRNGILLEAPI